MPDSAKKILVYSPDWVGDAVFSLPAIKSLRQTYPDAHISVLAKPWVSDVFRENPDINEHLVCEEKFNGIFGKLELAKILKAKSFDTAFLFTDSFGTAFTVWRAEIPERAGYGLNNRSMFLTQPVPPPGKDGHRAHSTGHYLNLIEASGVRGTSTPPWICLTLKERMKARQTFEGIKRPVVGITAGAYGEGAGQWPLERFTAIAQKFVKELNGSVMIFGWKSELDMANRIIKTFDPAEARARVISLVGKTTLRELSALLSECDVFLTNDSAPLYLAQAVGVPTVALFGCPDPASRMFSKAAVPVMADSDYNSNKDRILAITVNNVFATVQSQITKKRAIFLDKDGTLIEDMHYLNSFDDIHIFPNAKNHLMQLKDLGFMLIGITNQSGIDRGIVDPQFVKDSNRYLQQQLGIDAFYFCPHHPDRHCCCRKPEPSLLYEARMDHKIDLKASYFIGDKESDMLLAKNTGALGVLISPATPEKTNASHVAKDLENAVDWIMKREKVRL